VKSSDGGLHVQCSIRSSVGWAPANTSGRQPRLQDRFIVFLLEELSRADVGRESPFVGTPKL
jgi:hypothetical protein